MSRSRFKEREFESIHLEGEQVAEFHCHPTHCKKTYRMVVARKSLMVEKGEMWLIDDVKYFSYITNDRKMTMQEIVLFANDRCNQENVIGQLKSGVKALRMPSDGLGLYGHCSPGLVSESPVWIGDTGTRSKARYLADGI